MGLARRKELREEDACRIKQSSRDDKERRHGMVWGSCEDY